MKTKKEIIKETATFYNLKNRAVAKTGACFYKEGKKACAVGRCLRPDSKIIKEGLQGVISTIAYKLFPHFSSLDTAKVSFHLDQELKEEYRGHHVRFWDELQRFHDAPCNWSDTGLSEQGQKQLQTLYSKFAD